MRTTAAPTSHVINIWSEPSRYCVQYPVSDNRTDLLVVIQPGAMSLNSAEDAVHTALHNWHPRLQECLENVTDTCNHPVINSEPLDYWYAGKVVLLGDACHPLPVYSMQGACAAIEDAWVLGTMMERWEDTPAEGFSDYQRYRLPRVKKLRLQAIIAAANLSMAQRSDIWRRNVKWALTSRFLPEMSMEALDWLYGYDCIKGFD
jgi:salicylate hydroxylase